jgi:hypothetical protein
LFLLGISCEILAQNSSDSIQVKKRWYGTTYRQNGKRLRMKHLLAITKDNPDAYREVKIAKSNVVWGNVIGFTGAGCMAFSRGDITLFGPGLVLYLVAIPFSIEAGRHLKKGVKIYNQGLSNSGNIKVNFHLGFTNNGIGLRAAF